MVAKSHPPRDCWFFGAFFCRLHPHRGRFYVTCVMQPAPRYVRFFSLRDSIAGYESERACISAEPPCRGVLVPFLPSLSPIAVVGWRFALRSIHARRSVLGFLHFFPSQARQLHKKHVLLGVHLKKTLVKKSGNAFF